MNWETVDDSLLAMLLQMKGLQRQMISNDKVETRGFVLALQDFIDLIGKEIEKQGQ